MKCKLLAMCVLVVALGGAAAFSLHAQTHTPTGHDEPDIRRAMISLSTAEFSLRRADKGGAGHRERALSLTHQAIDECKAALKADR